GAAVVLRVHAVRQPPVSQHAGVRRHPRHRPQLVSQSGVYAGDAGAVSAADRRVERRTPAHGAAAGRPVRRAPTRSGGGRCVPVDGVGESAEHLLSPGTAAISQRARSGGLHLHAGAHRAQTAAREQRCLHHVSACRPAAGAPEMLQPS
ncbi:hypothetical protein M9458_031353, partial [Cirrhinus mrigala]